MKTNGENIKKRMKMSKRMEKRRNPMKENKEAKQASEESSFPH